MAEEIELVVDGERFAGWTSATVSQSFDASLVPTTCTLGYSPRVAEDLERVIIESGDAISLMVGDEELFSGYVDDDDLSYDAQSATFQVKIRSRCGDLVDCSAIHSSGRWRDQSLFRIAQDLLAEYEVAILDAAADADPIERHAIQTGESIADCLARAARLRGVILQDVGGDLVLTRTGQQRTSTVIERGRNVLTGRRSRSWRERFSHYHFCGQTRATDELYGLDASQIGNEIEDRQITRTRRLAVVAHSDRREDLGRRAILERNVRAGKSETLSYEVRGWLTDEGVLWRPNVLVRVADDWARVEAELLIQRVTQTFAAQPARYRTQLDLVRPETFAEAEYPVRGRGRSWRG